MAKTFFKYVKKRWWTFLIYMPALSYILPITFFLMFLFGLSTPSMEIFTYYMIVFLVLVFNTSIPMLIITIPAAKEIGVEMHKSKFKCFLIYHGIVCAVLAALLIVPYLLLLFLIFK